MWKEFVQKSGNYQVALILGGARSGKSRLALRLALERASPRLFLATGEPGDDEMASRIEQHHRARGEGWDTWEVPQDLVEALTAARDKYTVILVDCLTLWLSNLLMRDLTPADLEAACDQLLDTVQRATAPLILVSNEVGWGIVPNNPLARQFRDLAGGLHQRLAEAADLVVLTVAGLPTILKSTSGKETGHGT
jgi:adenosylcobinamide kinase/adenosylcobinamide-phosphate guanylyltransferase